ncbi:MAG TPA: HAD family hydrolase [Gemmatimonadaceae bacterium]|nr:HAD family hydrolase [Gemmatimonadaceae bacterium]
MNASERRRAVFFDRDGTLIRDVGYVGTPELVDLLPGAAAAVRRLNDAGWLAIVVTNQSGIARDFLTEDDYRRVNARFRDLMAEGGGRIDADYHCPHHPDYTGACACRKPGTELFERAAADWNVDIGTSAFIGDRWRDVEPSLILGGRGVLVPGKRTPDEEIARARTDGEVVGSVPEAVDRMLHGE